jgi:hypothetical protein
VTHRHNYKTCPLSDDDPAITVELLSEIMSGTESVKVIGTWMNGPAHEGYMVVEAESFGDVHRLLAAIAARGEIITVAVTDFHSVAELTKQLTKVAQSTCLTFAE